MAPLLRRVTKARSRRLRSEACTGSPGDARSGPDRAAIVRLVNAIAPDPEVRAVAYGKRNPYVDPGGRYARVVVVGLHDYGSPETRRLVTRIRDDIVPAARFPAGTVVVAGGPPPQGVVSPSSTARTGSN